MIDVAFPNMKYEVKDMEILDDWVYFCGEYKLSGSGMVGWFRMQDLFYGAGSLFIDNTLLSQGLITLDDIEVFKDQGGGVHIVGYGKHKDYIGSSVCDTTHSQLFLYKAFEAVGSPLSGMVYRTADLYGGGLYSRIEDVVVTDNYIVFLGCDKNQCCPLYHGVGIDLEVLPKFNMLSAPHIDLGQFMTIEDETRFIPGCTLVLRANSDPDEYQAKMVSIGQDRVAVCSHRVDIDYSFVPLSCQDCQIEPRSTCYLAHRIYDISPLFTNNPIIMTSAVAATLPSSRGMVECVKGLRYDNCHYYVLHKFEGSTGSGVVDCAVTKFDFSSGIPTMAESDFQNTAPWNNWEPESICLSIGGVYTVSGKENSALHYFRKTPFVSTSGGCLYQNRWVVKPIPTIVAKQNTWPLDAGSFVGLNCVEYVGVRSNDVIQIICE